MKSGLLYFVFFVVVMMPFASKGQTFTMQYDTVTARLTGTGVVKDNVINLTSSPLTLSWHVVASNFPADWLTATAFGICDNNICYNNGPDGHGASMRLWNDTTSTGDIQTTVPYGDTTTQGLFELSLNLSSVTSSGCYFVTVALNNGGSFGTSKTVTFVVCRSGASVAQVGNTQNDLLLYPNPAGNEVNLVYDASADVKNIAIYNIIGKVLTVYRVTGSSANLNIENIPSGIYFARLYNGAGNVVATRKFTKQ